MKKTTTTTVAGYLKELPADRRAEIEPVLQVMRSNMPKGYQEAMAYGMITWAVPLSIYPDTYNKQPLCYAGLVSNKSSLTLHLMPVYGSKPHLQKLKDGFKAAGKKLDIGKACIRFKRADDLALDAIGDVVASVPVDRFVMTAELARRRRRK